MSISKATKHLATLLKDYFLSVDPKNTVISFLDAVSQISEFRDKGTLNEWESAVLNVYTDTEWEKFENRYDFGVIESVWEVGRFNLYGSIDERETMQLYQKAANNVKNLTGFAAFEANYFDFSKW